MKTKADILAGLQRDILSLQGYKPAATQAVEAIGLEQIVNAFPGARFPFAGVHEFFCSGEEDAAASGAFVSGLLSSLGHNKGKTLWVSSCRTIFPPALKLFCLHPHQVTFLDLKREKEVLWAVEEALKCTALTTVIGEVGELSFTASRRFQLAIEKTGVGCFILRRRPKSVATAAISRWQIKPLLSRTADDLPGVGYPRWQVDLVKVRNGRPGSWVLEWVDGHFRTVSKLAVLHKALQQKTG